MRDAAIRKEQKTEMEEAYGKYTFRKVLLIIALFFATFLMAGISLSFNGLDGVGVIESYRYIFKHIMGATYDRITEVTVTVPVSWSFSIRLLMVTVELLKSYSIE